MFGFVSKHNFIFDVSLMCPISQSVVLAFGGSPIGPSPVCDAGQPVPPRAAAEERAEADRACAGEVPEHVRAYAFA